MKLSSKGAAEPIRPNANVRFTSVKRPIDISSPVLDGVGHC